MTSEQIDISIQLIRGYNFVFEATGQENYRITRDNLLNALTALLWGDILDTNVILLKVA